MPISTTHAPHYGSGNISVSRVRDTRPGEKFDAVSIEVNGKTIDLPINEAATLAAGIVHSLAL